MDNRFDGIFYSPGRVDYYFGVERNAELKLSPYFWGDFKRLIFMNDGLGFLTHVLGKDALKSYESGKSENKPNEHHLHATLSYIFNKTIYFNKVCELISYGDVERGNPKQLIFTCKMSRSSVRKSMDILYEQGVLIKTGLESLSGNVIFLNVPFIIETLHDGLFEFVKTTKIDDNTLGRIIWSIPQATTLYHFWGRYFDGDFKEFVKSMPSTSERDFKKEWDSRCPDVVKLPAPASSKTLDMEKHDPYAIMYKDLYPGEVKEYVIFEGAHFPPWFFRDSLVIIKGKNKIAYAYEDIHTADCLDEKTKEALHKYFGITVAGYGEVTPEKSDVRQVVQ